MKKKTLIAKLCICALTVSMLSSGCAGSDTQTSTGETSQETETAAETAAETASEAATETAVSDATPLEVTDVFASQNSIDEALKKEAESGYSFEEPSIIVNPYGTAPLTAVIVFNNFSESQ